MKIALYKGRQRFISKLICYWTQSPYSHVELVFSDGMCGSSHDMDLGVRLKKIDFTHDSDQWDFLEVDGDEAYARQWFENHSKEPYDYLGLLSYILPVKNNPYKWTCVKAVLTALKFDDAWRFEPSMLPSILKGRQTETVAEESKPLFSTLIKDQGYIPVRFDRDIPSRRIRPMSCESPSCTICADPIWTTPVNEESNEQL